MEQFTLDANLLRHAQLHLAISVGLWILVIAAIILDLWDGIKTAKILHQRIHSHKLRVTIEKVSEYWRFMLIAFLIDTIGILFPFYSLPFLSILFCIGLVGVEFKSMFEHAKKRKSKAVEMEDVIKLVIQSASEHDAKKAMERVAEYLELQKAKQA